MSHWKDLVNHSQSKQSSHSRRSSVKYNPKKQKHINQSLMFRNESISKVQNSVIESQKMLRSRSASKSEYNHNKFIAKQMAYSASDNYSKKMSQINLHNLQGKSGLKIKKVNTIDYEKQFHLVDQIQFLKNQFKKFQIMIIKQIQKQQVMLKKMFEEVIQKMNVQTKNIDLYKQLATENSPSTNYLNEKLQSLADVKISASTPDLIASQRKQKVDNLLPYKQSNVSTYSTNPHKNLSKENDIFAKFFSAMNCLKQQMKQIGNLTQFKTGLPAMKTVNTIQTAQKS